VTLRPFAALAVALGFLAGSAAPSEGGQGRLDQSRVTIGLAQHATSFLPVYLAAERTFQGEGLTARVVGFSSGTALAQALASESVDIGVASLNVMVQAIQAGQPVRVFYAGMTLADFEWFARPPVGAWADLHGKGVAISNYGSLTDFLTRYALRRHGAELERSVRLVPAGTPASVFTALRVGRTDAAILLPPFKWRAAELGWVRLGTQATEIGPEWPRSVFAAKARFLDTRPEVVRAVLRAHVRAIRLLRRDREAAVRALAKWLRYERLDAERAYTEARAGFDERGRLPAGAMTVFWDSVTAAGEAPEAWREARFLDRRFLDTFDEWAPR
jgi:NitT/TauT family transport system substrate-binding protein